MYFWKYFIACYAEAQSQLPLLCCRRRRRRRSRFWILCGAHFVKISFRFEFSKQKLVAGARREKKRSKKEKTFCCSAICLNNLLYIKLNVRKDTETQLEVHTNTAADWETDTATVRDPDRDIDRLTTRDTYRFADRAIDTYIDKDTATAIGKDTATAIDTSLDKAAKCFGSFQYDASGRANDDVCWRYLCLRLCFRCCCTTPWPCYCVVSRPLSVCGVSLWDWVLATLSSVGATLRISVKWNNLTKARYTDTKWIVYLCSWYLCL